MERGVFITVNKSDSDGLRIYGSYFVDTVKQEGTPNAFEKSRLVVQIFNDNHGLMTHAPTVQQSSQLLLLALFVSGPTFKFFARDVSQSYLNSKTNIKLPIFVRPPAIHGYPRETFFRVNSPLYGIPEAVLHWYYTYHKYHVNNLKMKPSIYDTCLLYTERSLAKNSKKQSMQRGMVCLQTDDTEYAGNDAFIKLKDSAKKMFQSEKSEVLNSGYSLKFNGRTIKLYDN